MNRVSKYVYRQQEERSSRSNNHFTTTVASRATARIFLTIGVLMTVPMSVEAQTAAKLVSNLDQGEDSSRQTVRPTSQRFTTGGNADRYSLASIEIKMDASLDNHDFAVDIYTVDSNGRPDMVHASLIPPASFAAGTLVFAAEANVTLATNTTYAIVATPRDVVIPDAATLQEMFPNIDATKHDLVSVYRQIHSGIQLDATSSDAEDPSAQGWSIANHYEARLSGDGTWTAAGDGVSLQVAINGSAVGTGPDLSANATLSDLTLSDGATLNPTFASGTTDYTASVGNSLSQITVAATPDDAQASVVCLDANNAVLEDADAAAGHQVTLAVGANTIKVKVTAQDANTAGMYTIVVTRQANDVSVPTGAISGAPQYLKAIPGNAHVTLTWNAPYYMDGIQPQGWHTVRFNADGLPTGTYVYRLTAGGQTLTHMMTLVR